MLMRLQMRVREMTKHSLETMTRSEGPTGPRNHSPEGASSRSCRSRHQRQPLQRKTQNTRNRRSWLRERHSAPRHPLSHHMMSSPTHHWHSQRQQTQTRSVAAKQAMREPDAKDFRKAMAKEIVDQWDHGNCSLINREDVPDGALMLPGVWSQKKEVDRGCGGCQVAQGTLELGRKMPTVWSPLHPHAQPHGFLAMCQTAIGSVVDS